MDSGLVIRSGVRPSVGFVLAKEQGRPLASMIARVAMSTMSMADATGRVTDSFVDSGALLFIRS